MSILSSARRCVGVTAIAAACAAVALPAVAQAAPSPADTTGSAVSAAPEVSRAAWAAGRARFGADATAAQAVSAYWTVERMREAKPIEEAAFLGEAADAHEKSAKADLRAARSLVKKKIRPPKAGPELQVAPATAAAVESEGVEAAFNPNLDYWHPTARTNGKVFFKMNGQSYQCSASIVNSEGLDTVWSAGHCVHSGRNGVWATDWQFVPSYDDDLVNPRPYGTWTAAALWSMTGWTSNSDFSEDMGVAIMAPRGTTHIVSYLGGNGFRANIGKYVFENAFGYPAEAPFDGGNLWRCWGNSQPEWTVLWWSAETLKIPCDMTRGSSGGPWLHDYNTAAYPGFGWLNGVNSRIDRIVGPTIMLSPYFDNTALALYNATRFL